MTNSDVVGYWKITRMEVWGQDYVDLLLNAPFQAS